MGKQRMKKALSVALSASMAIGALASVQPFPAVAAVTSGIVTRLADDMVVANSVYGWVTEDAAENSDHTIVSGSCQQDKPKRQSIPQQ